MPIENNDIPFWARDEDYMNEIDNQSPPPLQNIRLTTENQILIVNQQSQIIQALQSNADILIAHYRKTQSMLSWLAEEYGKRSWLYTALESISITSISLFLSTFGPIAMMIGSIACTIYYISSILLSNHYWITTQNEKFLQTNIQLMEKDLKTSVTQLQIIETKLNDAVSALKDQHNILFTKAILLANNIDQLAEQVKVFEKETHTLMLSHLAIMEQIPNIVNNLKQTIDSIQENNQDLTNQTNNLNTINNNLATTTLEIDLKSKQLTHTATIFDQEIGQLATLIDSVKQLHCVLEKKPIENSLINQNLLDLRKELDQHIQEKETRLKKYEDLRARASKSLQQSHRMNL